MDDDLVNSSVWFRYLVIAALFGSVGNGTLGLIQSDGNYSAEDARRDFSLRDERATQHEQLGDHAGRIRIIEDRLSTHEHDTRLHNDDRR